MKANNVLVLGSDGSGELVEELFNGGFDPVAKETISQAVDSLRHDAYAAVVIDRTHSAADIIECVLNLRDVDADIPVLTIGRGYLVEEEKVLPQQSRVWMFKDMGIQDVTWQLQSLLNEF
ncbi:MAG: hypothetical protein K9N51_07545 [Candidatus Pacebacteria bacterium]|nr:hypothetical protein [Candidatus Paceibacterota bacterium]